MAEEYQESEMSKIVKKLMDEEGFEFGEAVKEAMRRTRKDVAGGGNINYIGNMMRSNYAMGSEDIPELEEMQSDEYRDLLKSLNAPTEDQASGIMGLKENAPSIKMAGGVDPMLLREYEKYVFEIREMGGEPMPLKMFIDQILAEARRGVNVGGMMRANYAEGTPKKKDLKEYNFMELVDKDAEDEYYKIKEEQMLRKYYPEDYPPSQRTMGMEDLRKMINKAEKEKEKRAKGGIAGVL